MMGGGPVSFDSLTQTLVAQSILEAELIALGYGAKYAAYLLNQLSEMMSFKNEAVVLNTDQLGQRVRIGIG